MKYKYTIIAALLVIIHFVVICDLAKSDNNIISPKPYALVSSKDLSIKALTKELSQYSHSELKSLPLIIRKEYRIVVPSDISKEELKATMMHLVAQETKKNEKIIIQQVAEKFSISEEQLNKISVKVTSYKMR